MLTNETRRELLNRAKASGFPGSITDVFQAADQGIDLIEQHQMQQQQEQEMQVANTPQQQETGLREQHAMGNTQASMAFPDVQPNQSFNTIGMKAPIDIQKIDDQGHLVESYKNVPPGIQDLPTGPSEGTIIESPAAYQKGGFNFNKTNDYSPEAVEQRRKNQNVNYEDVELAASFLPYVGEGIDAKNTIKDLRAGNYGGAALNAVGFAIPFVPGGAIKRGYKFLKNKIKSKPRSDINWGKWNKEIPGNTALIDEYKHIEEITKSRGTWMKNANGSKFKGSPEQFVQQKSKNFNTSFPNALREDGKIMPLVHHSDKEFTFFDASKEGNTKYGEGVYTRPKAFHDKRVAKSFAEMMDKSNEKSVFQMYGNKRYNLYSNNTPTLKKLEYRNERGFNPRGSRGSVDGPIYPVTSEDISTIISPYSNPLKSMKGNDGMFDMKNPNIYKQKGGRRMIDPNNTIYVRLQERSKRIRGNSG